VDEANALGAYLRARRELVSPEDVGLRVSGLRRVAGLRREEVATLAGISSDYYLRLEQGRDRHPSVQVLEALARVLQLDPGAAEYLITLAQPRSRARRERPRRERVPVGITQLVETVGLPAFVEGRYFDVLASNAMARALSPNLVVGANRLRSMFLDAGERALYPDLERALAGMVAGFRVSVGTATDDPRCVQLVGELSLVSDHFRRLWARHDVKIREGAPQAFHHPQVGDLTLRREKLEIGGSDGQLLVIYHAEAGSESARSLLLLGSLAATQEVVSPEAEAETGSRGSAAR
jgi:transcriptional regulator with XRE-family HTH domain